MSKRRSLITQFSLALVLWSVCCAGEGGGRAGAAASPPQPAAASRPEEARPPAKAKAGKSHKPDPGGTRRGTQDGSARPAGQLRRGYPEPAMEKPPAGVPFVEPIFGKKMLRVTDAAADGGDRWSVEYSRINPFNADERYYMLYAPDTNFWLFDARTNQKLRKLPGSGINGEPRWSRTDPDVYYFHRTSPPFTWNKVNISSNSVVTLHTYSEYTAITGTNESNLSSDGARYLLAGKLPLQYAHAGPITSPSGNQVAISWSPFKEAATYTVMRSLSHSGPYTVMASGIDRSRQYYTDIEAKDGIPYYYRVAAVDPLGKEMGTVARLDSFEFFLIDVSTGEKLAVINDNRGDWCSVSPDGDFILKSYGRKYSGTVESGVWLFDRNFKRIRKICDEADHADIGYDADGTQCYVTGGLNADKPWFTKYRILKDGSVESLKVLENILSNGKADWTSSHVSMQAQRRPGWALISFMASGNPGEAAGKAYWPDTRHDPFENEILWLKLDGSQTVERICQSRTHLTSPTRKMKDYFAEPHATTNSSGSRILFSTNWGDLPDTGNSRVDVYLVDLAEGAAPEHPLDHSLEAVTRQVFP